MLSPDPPEPDPLEPAPDVLSEDPVELPLVSLEFFFFELFEDFPEADPDPVDTVESDPDDVLFVSVVLAPDVLEGDELPELPVLVLGVLELPALLPLLPVLVPFGFV